MSHPKNRVKLTGDTHPPELDDVIVLAAQDDADIPMQRPPEATARKLAPARLEEFTASCKSRWLDRLPYADQARGYATQARSRVGEQPLAALGIALALGLVVGKLMRR
jgi:ElaB/YqjD/DUF883 family membrane-anchored ribosome-binding protein